MNDFDENNVGELNTGLALIPLSSEMQCQDDPRWQCLPWLQCRWREWVLPPRSLAADAHDCIMV